MKTYVCTSFKGHWPVGTSAVVSAKDEPTARLLLSQELARQGLTLQDDDKLEQLARNSALVLNDGNY